MEASSAEDSPSRERESATQNDKVLPQNAAISHAFVGGIEWTPASSFPAQPQLETCSLLLATDTSK